MQATGLREAQRDTLHIHFEFGRRWRWAQEKPAPVSHPPRALTNVARHASGYPVDISLEEEQDCVCLRIQDNGRGITEGRVNGPESFGLLGMRERALLYSGDFSIQGTPGQGTTVAIRLPLDKGRSAMIRVLIADDHPIVRQGLNRFLATRANMLVAGEAINGQEVLAKVRAEPWDVVVLDISMPDQSGLDILKQLRVEQPRLPCWC